MRRSEGLVSHRRFAETKKARRRKVKRLKTAFESFRPSTRILSKMHDRDDVDCGKEEPQRHRRRLPTFLNTSVADTVFNFPFSNASSRLSTSIAHSASTFVREGNSKLAKSFSISSARSMGGSSSALENKCRVFGDMNRLPPCCPSLTGLRGERNRRRGCSPVRTPVVFTTTSACDVNGDKSTTVVDVQRVVNAALGGACQ
jgi:hypothetical protein